MAVSVAAWFSVTMAPASTIIAIESSLKMDLYGLVFISHLRSEDPQWKFIGLESMIIDRQGEDVGIAHHIGFAVPPHITAKIVHERAVNNDNLVMSLLARHESRGHISLTNKAICMVHALVSELFGACRSASGQKTVADQRFGL
ncbi:MAG: hypothetical protein WAO07_17465 [Desulfobacterales bacterium]